MFLYLIDDYKFLFMKNHGYANVILNKTENLSESSISGIFHLKYTDIWLMLSISNPLDIFGIGKLLLSSILLESKRFSRVTGCCRGCDIHPGY